MYVGLPCLLRLQKSTYRPNNEDACHFSAEEDPTMSCTASSTDGTCSPPSALGFVHKGLANMALKLFSTESSIEASDPAAYVISALFTSTLLLFALILHYVNKEWHLWRDIKLTIEGILDRLPSIESEVQLPVLQSMKSSNIKPPALLDPKKPTLLNCFSPSTLSELGTVPNLSTAEVNTLASRAKVAQASWKYSTFPQRRRVLRTLQKYIVSHVEEICKLSAADSGKTRVDALLGEILTTCEKIRTLLHHGETWLEKSYRPVNPMMMHKTAYVEYVPIGVLGIIAPWNYPFHNMLNHVLSGLFSGNAVMTKVSEHTSWSSVYFHNICRAALEVNGFDPELLQLCTGGAETGKALVECADVDKIVSLVHFYRIVFLCSLGTDDIWCSSLQGLQV
jgi:hypothetical protein